MTFEKSKPAGGGKVARMSLSQHQQGLHPRARTSCRKQLGARDVKKLKGDKRKRVYRGPRMTTQDYARHEEEDDDGHNLEDEELELQVDEKVCLLIE